MTLTIGKRYLVYTDKTLEQMPSVDKFGKPILQQYEKYTEQYFDDISKAYTYYKALIKNSYYTGIRCLEIDLDTTTIRPMTEWENNDALHLAGQVEKELRNYFDRFQIRSMVKDDKITISISNERISKLGCEIIVDKVFADNQDNWNKQVKIRLNKKDIKIFRPKGV